MELGMRCGRGGAVGAVGVVRVAKKKKKDSLISSLLNCYNLCFYSLICTLSKRLVNTVKSISYFK
jgi:hypothetical protein